MTTTYAVANRKGGVGIMLDGDLLAVAELYLDEERARERMDEITEW